MAGAARDKMIEIANKIAETTPAIIDRKYFVPFNLMCRRIKEKAVDSGVGPQTGRGQRNETRFENDQGGDGRNASYSESLLNGE